MRQGVGFVAAYVVASGTMDRRLYCHMCHHEERAAMRALFAVGLVLRLRHCAVQYRTPQWRQGSWASQGRLFDGLTASAWQAAHLPLLSVWWPHMGWRHAMLEHNFGSVVKPLQLSQCRGVPKLNCTVTSIKWAKSLITSYMTSPRYIPSLCSTTATNTRIERNCN